MSSHAQIRAAKKKYIQRALKRHQRNINAACSTNNDELNKAGELKFAELDNSRDQVYDNQSMFELPRENDTQETTFCDFVNTTNCEELTDDVNLKADSMLSDAEYGYNLSLSDSGTVSTHDESDNNFALSYYPTCSSDDEEN